MSAAQSPASQASHFVQPLGPHGFRWLAALGVVWLFALVIGIGLLWTHSHAAGDLQMPPTVWPLGSQLPHEAGRPTLVFFAHPRCPCTHASLRELDRLLAHSPKQLDTLVVFARPEGVADDWTDTSVWSLARGIAGVTTFVDDGGVEGKRFAAKTSGQVCLYGADGRLLFHGGITSARGHEGDNTGRSALQLLMNGRPADRCTPVYGCSLNSPAPVSGG